MIDTVRIKHHFTGHYTAQQLRSLGAVDVSRQANKGRWALNPPNGKALPRITFSFPNDGLMHINAEVSVPRMLFDHNSRLPVEEEVKAALTSMCEYVAFKADLDFPIETARVVRADFAYDFLIDEREAHRAILKLSRYKLPLMTKNIHEDTTIYFRTRAGGKEIRIYPKFLEVADKNGSIEARREAAGKLRFEYCLLKRGNISALVTRLGLPDSFAPSVLTGQVHKELFTELFTRLDFPSSVVDEDNDIVNLLTIYPVRKAMTLLGYVTLQDHFGPTFYKDGSFKLDYQANRRLALDLARARNTKRHKPLV